MIKARMEFPEGTSQEAAFNGALTFAHEHNARVEFEHNGIHLVVKPGKTYEQLVAIYERKLSEDE